MLGPPARAHVRILQERPTSYLMPKNVHSIPGRGILLLPVSEIKLCIQITWNLLWRTNTMCPTFSKILAGASPGKTQQFYYWMCPILVELWKLSLVQNTTRINRSFQPAHFTDTTALHSKDLRVVPSLLFSFISWNWTGFVDMRVVMTFYLLLISVKGESVLI